MSQRRLAIDLAATLLLIAGLAAAAAVYGYKPGQPLTAHLVPELKEFHRHDPAIVLGQAVGLAVHPLLAAWFVAVVVLFLRRNLGRWLLRLAGWTLVVCATALGCHWLRMYEGLPVHGGWLGHELDQQLGIHLVPEAIPAVAAGCLVVGVLAAFDVFVLAACGMVQHLIRRLGGKAGAGGRWRTQLGQWLRWPLVRGLGLLRRGPSRLRPVPVRSVTENGIPITHAAFQAPIPSAQPTLPATEPVDYELPPLSLLADTEPFPHEQHDQHLRDTAALLEKTFADFGLKVRVAAIHTGPVITQYEVTLETGLRVSKVISLADDVALNLKSPSVRMAPVPGRNTVGIEVPNEHRAVVRLKELITASPQVASRKQKLPLFLGKDSEGKPLVYDLAEMPHLLIAGRTGTGKSVCMNAIILSLLMTRRPDEVKMIMIDPKMLELSEYGRIPHLMHPVVKDMKKAEAILSWAVDKMEERYDILSRARVRSIAGYNDLPYEEILRRVKPADEEDRRRVPPKMPYIVLFIDEMADLILMMKKEVESHIIRLAQKSRAAGIHLVVATQKPTVDVITGLIKSNLPARICFQVSSRSDSRVVLDEMGADKLLGKGDMLFLQPGTSTLLRSQGTYASGEEIAKVTDYLECDPEFETELVQLHTGKEGKGGFLESLRARDEVYEAAIDVVVREGRGSVSLLQRALGIGYGRGARLIDFMAEDGIVGHYNGSQARDVLYTPEAWDKVKQSGKLAVGSH